MLVYIVTHIDYIIFSILKNEQKSLLTCGRKWLTSTTDEVLGSRWFQYTVNNDHQHFKNYSMAVPLKMLICNVTQPNLSKSKFYPSNFVYFWKSEYSIYTKLFMNGFKSCNTGVFCLVQWSPIHWILKNDIMAALMFDFVFDLKITKITTPPVLNHSSGIMSRVQLISISKDGLLFSYTLCLSMFKIWCIRRWCTLIGIIMI